MGILIFIVIILMIWSFLLSSRVNKAIGVIEDLEQDIYDLNRTIQSL